LAKNNQADLSPERRVARLLLKRNNLVPPIPVKDLLEECADIEEALPPINIDGLVWLPDIGRPRVILNSSKRNQNRKRFTMAHELGHIILPWQTGMMACHIEEGIGLEQTYRNNEMEANRFAGELLVPSDWAKDTIKELNHKLARNILEIGKIAEVSPMVSAFTIANVLSTTMIFITQNGSTIMNILGSALGQWGRRDWNPEFIHQYALLGADYSSADFGDYQIHCFEIKLRTLLKRPANSATGLLEEIVYSLEKSEKNRNSLIGRVNGIIGAANAKITATEIRDFNIALRHRFVSHPDLEKVIKHAKFGDFLLSKAYELINKK
jgi:Zn-dependent peptidase ImmA (M78 family)